MKEIFKKMFFKWGICLFDASTKECGGFNQWIARLFKCRIGTIVISVHSEFRFECVFFDDAHYYDGYHNYIWFGPFSIYLWM